MNAKILFKTIFLIAIAVLLVMMGMNNRQIVELSLPPLLQKPQKLAAAFMYIGFFGGGLLTGVILTAGGGGKKSSGSSGKASKSEK